MIFDACVELAHVYYVNVYVALNTILTDEELPQAVSLIEQLYAIGIDGLIIQDMGLLAMDLAADSLDRQHADE